jgi:hypothetical protein
MNTSTDAVGKFGAEVCEHLTNNITLVTAGGKIIGSCLKEPLADLLAKWYRLPPKERMPGSLRIEEPGPRDPAWTFTDPPPGGLTLSVFTRNLRRGGKGNLVKGEYIYPLSGSWISHDALRDSLWLTEAEWRSLVPHNPRKGDTFPVASAIQDRIFRYYLSERYRTYDRPWSKAAIRSGKLTAMVEDVAPTRLRLRIDGSVQIATDVDTARAKNGYEGSLLGYLEYDREQRVFTRFDLLALGDNSWSERDRMESFRETYLLSRVYEENLGRGITVGVLFELAPPGSGFHYIPPGASNQWSKRPDYWGKDPRN